MPTNPSPPQEDEYEKLRKDIERAIGGLCEVLSEKKDRDLNAAAKSYSAVFKNITERLRGLQYYADVREQKFQELRENVEALRIKVEKLTMPPLRFATVVAVHEDKTVIVATKNSDEMKVQSADPDTAHELRAGQRVLLNELGVIVEHAEFEIVGDIGTVEEALDGGRLSLATHTDEKRVVRLAGPMAGETFSVGDTVLYDPKTAFVLERLTKPEMKELWLEEVPQVTYEQIGGLQKQITQIRNEVEVPFLYPEHFKAYELEVSKGILLYGPPGCGKTLIAKAIARNLTDRMAKQSKKDVHGYFMNVKGPELLNKFVGESERKIREMFSTARKRASQECIVVVFIDEADAVFRTRGTGISSDVESTIVPQFLSEIDGLESLKNVLVVLATNRQELIDPAVLRSGRIDRKILVNRPDMDGSREVFGVYLKGRSIPVHRKYTDVKHPKYDPGAYEKFVNDPDAARDHMIERAIARLWATKNDYQYTSPDGKIVKVDNGLIETTLQGGEKMTLYLRDFVSGAMIENIVRRAKRNAIDRIITFGDAEGGLQARDLCVGIEAEMSEAEDLPNIGENVQQWLDMQGRRERVVHARSLVADRRREIDEQKKVETVTIGHYL